MPSGFWLLFQYCDGGIGLAVLQLTSDGQAQNACANDEEIGGQHA
jgi:hypothetical protein